MIHNDQVSDGHSCVVVRYSYSQHITHSKFIISKTTSRFETFSNCPYAVISNKQVLVYPLLITHTAYNIIWERNVAIAV